MYVSLDPAEGFFLIKNRKVQEVSNNFVKKFRGIEINNWIVRANGRLISFDTKQKAIEKGRTIGSGELLQSIKGNILNGKCYRREGVFRAVEGNDAMIAYLGDRLIAKEAIAKADPMNDADFVDYIVLLARKMDLTTAGTDAEYEKAYMKVVNAIDWTDIETKQLNAAIKVLNDFLPPSLPKVMKKIKITLKDQAERVYKDTKKSMKNNFGFDISTSLNLPDKRAIDAIANFGESYIPTSFKKQSASLSNTVKRQAEYGLKKGFSSEKIAGLIYDELKQKIPTRRNTWVKLAAHATVSRARSRSQINGYLEADIEKAVVLAVLDEATTEICTFLDGKVVDVKVLDKKWTELEEADDPDFEATFPWMKQSKSGDKTTISIGNTKIASGASGALSFLPGVNMKEAMALGVGFPPYHPFCRSTTIVELN